MIVNRFKKLRKQRMNYKIKIKFAPKKIKFPYMNYTITSLEIVYKHKILNVHHVRKSYISLQCIFFLNIYRETRMTIIGIGIDKICVHTYINLGKTTFMYF